MAGPHNHLSVVFEELPSTFHNGCTSYIPTEVCRGTFLHVCQYLVSLTWLMPAILMSIWWCLASTLVHMSPLLCWFWPQPFMLHTLGCLGVSSYSFVNSLWMSTICFKKKDNPEAERWLSGLRHSLSSLVI